MKNKIFIIFVIFLLALSSCKKKNNKEDNNNNNEPGIVDPEPVKPKLESIELSLSKESIYIGETSTLSVKLNPTIDTEYTITYLDSLEDKEVVEFNDVTYTGLNQGKLFITVVSNDNPNIRASITLEVIHPLMETEVYKATEIVGIFGSDAASMYEINYQIKNTKSFVLLTKETDTEWTDYAEYYGDGFYFEQVDSRLQASFYPRNVWHVSIEGLESNTSYMYKIDNGDGTYSDIYHFRTAGGDSKTSFLFLTDNHYYHATDGSISSAALSEETIKNAYNINPNISFIVGGGDRIDHGGNEIDWQTYFKYAKSLQQFPFIDTPGNHEYYSNLPSSGNIYFDVYSAGGDNGADELKGSTCWFKHNDTLIIMMDDSTNTGYTSQMNWVANLLETVDYKYSILVFHKPCHIPGSQDYNEEIMKLCDKYSVDLVLCGHYHYQDVEMNHYQGATTSDPYLGTTYFEGDISGIKSASSPANAINEARGYIIDIDDNEITIRVMIANGTLKETYHITNRTVDSFEVKSKDELLSSISMSTNDEENKVTFNLSEYFFGNVKKVIVNETNRNKINDYMVFPSPSYKTFTLNNLPDHYDYHFKMTIIFSDGEERTLEFDWNRHRDININCVALFDTIASITFDEYDSAFKYLIKNYEIYLDDKLVDNRLYLEQGIINNVFSFDDLTPLTTYTIELRFYNYEDELMFSHKYKFTTTE